MAVQSGIRLMAMADADALMADAVLKERQRTHDKYSHPNISCCRKA